MMDTFDLAWYAMHVSHIFLPPTRCQTTMAWFGSVHGMDSLGINLVSIRSFQEPFMLADLDEMSH